MTETQKKWREENREKYNEYHKRYRAEHDNRVYWKEYNQKRKEKLKEYSKKQYEKKLAAKTKGVTNE